MSELNTASRRLTLAVALACFFIGGVSFQALSRDFGEVFADSTIRLDYILAGTSKAPQTALAHTSTWGGWAGRRANMDKYPLHGNIQLTATQNGDTVYTTAMSNLYNEWLETGDTVARAFECTILMPKPHMPTDITLTVYDSRRRPLSVHRHRLDPKDILIRKLGNKPNNTVTIHSGRYEGPKIKVAYLPEGFTEAQMDSFHIYARQATEAILEHEPFKSLADRFDFVAVDVPSADSDVSHPLTADWRRTAFDSHFSTFYSDRYLTVPSVFKLHDALAGVPYEHIIVLANTPVYGGGGIFNSYTVTNTGNPQFKPVVVHEFGHSFGGLADEYFYEEDVMTDTYPTDVEPWEPNITTLVNFKGKWENLIAEGTPVPTPAPSKASGAQSSNSTGTREATKASTARQTDKDFTTVGVYEGAGYSTYGLYRPADYCRMRVNDVPAFCPACQQALRRLILFYTD